MKSLILATIPFVLSGASCLSAAEPELSIEQVLKIGVDDLAVKLGNASEAGEDDAAQLWATARRLKTEAALGKSSVQAVKRLAEWRAVINRWMDAAVFSSSIESGGGSLYSHIANRNDAAIEAFLAKYYVALSAVPKKGAPCQLEFNKKALANIKAGLKEADADDESGQDFAKRMTDTLNREQENLRYLLQHLSDEKVKKEVTKWLMERSGGLE